MEGRTWRPERNTAALPWRWIAALLILQMLGVLTTVLAVNYMGVSREANPLLRPVVGSWLLPVIKLAGGLVIIRLTAIRAPRVLKWAVYLYGSVVAFNVGGIVLALVLGGLS